MGRSLDIDLCKQSIENDSVRGVWSVKSKDIGKLWCDGSSIAQGGALEIDKEIVEDEC